MNWKLKGGHKQETRSGYNFWKPFTSQTKNGVTLTVKDDGSYVLSGTATQTTSFYVNGLNYDAADYTIALFNSTAISNEAFYVQVEHENGLLKQAFLTTNTIKSSTTGKVNALSIVIPADLTLNNFTFKPMLLKGIYTANTMLRFEQYGMMPSTDYLSEIRIVGSNENLFDGTIKASNQRISTHGTGTYAAQGYSISDYIEILSDTDYIISTDDSFYCLYDKDKKFVSGNSFSNRKKCTTNSNAKYIKFDFKTEEANKIKLEKGSTATPWSAYGTGCVEKKVQNRNFLYYTAQNQTINDVEFLINKDKSIKVKGTATATADFYLIGNANTYEDIGVTGNFKISGCKSNSSSKYMLYIVQKDINNKLSYYQNVQESINITIKKGDTFRVFIRVLSQITVNDTIFPALQSSDDNNSIYVESKKQTIVMPVQQEMLQGDYIEDVEHHEWGKLVLKGDEGWEIASTNPHQDKTTYFQTRRFDNLLKTEEIISNYFTKKKLWEEDVEGIVCAPSSAYSLRMRVNKTIASTSSKLNAYLKARYDANDPIVIYYKLANAIDLELTEAQKAVREQKLHTYKNITNINLSDELASIDVTYKKDLDTILNNLQAQIIANASEEVTE
ncbi:MAG: hypothetical protein U0O04_03880 [Clostridia bacterium]